MTAHDLLHARMATSRAVRDLLIRSRRHAPADPTRRLIDDASRRRDVPRAGPAIQDWAPQDWAPQDWALQDWAIQLSKRDRVRVDGRPAQALLLPDSRATPTGMPEPPARGVGDPGV